jgi:hypothetical protein
MSRDLLFKQRSKKGPFRLVSVDDVPANEDVLSEELKKRLKKKKRLKRNNDLQDAYDEYEM